MVNRISILGSTGSIGVQTLDVARNLNIKVDGLAANKNIDLLEKQAREFQPKIVAVKDEERARILRDRLSDTDCKVVGGVEGLKMVASIETVETVVTSIVGIAGLIPTMEAIKHKKNIALANKETLVTAGHIVMSEAARMGVKILPVDSEHSAVFQSLMGNNKKDVAKIILTASGGPFRGRKKEELRNVTLREALNHPNWSMGSKITIDSATMMNKGLEVIEAHWLFEIPQDDIEVLVHPQSIIHSMVEYKDGSIIAQLGSPDMRLPIQFALTYPDRKQNNFSKLDIVKIGSLTFEAPDLEAFPCLGLAFEALRAGGTMPAVLNAANEKAVGLFLQEKIRFLDIPEIIEKVMGRHSVKPDPDIDDIIDVDLWARKIVEEIVK
ncbi:MAG TPA: 1-deoxy-D-xylulose-5-phosphate reductoisomerase [Hungateiclostridium thermocellum]|jgi:1-deoxy-D-xylulose-5-phosphate reductoisomerase|uniref:1-deoxy-D-xylulose 5-phosphate reductoisomerase n=2 Tax=Acetivibrio thermocellus TaxID=1515 RepID=DXR_ACET2|nr:1-deoxy-D-xylulose-5-phosphate reductoisomerase [Acetivibrio thermocellus]A3DE52.1 RecName: Full=1-deoxy-D-xylulose 5-phosphate reductoisomerase; Short=DXP reductoisomerase; AltName: Full=1-deoxyxylulose-5-phosphate reductoisomerase; AltName: Full=2-C-methyl-D-erythritol 4-phosphate synthase [Acetivibrio thermocellus ATCC 27405]CDG35693.1 1-deoxy-D-xylulose 5-phosphate reductoisomerase [Acetivibrio thermocellus BC1]ABN52231.1 1-deoxy-D-xylulose 5-phosphate reductoisomerase [Acetivibrio thermo